MYDLLSSFLTGINTLNAYLKSPTEEYGGRFLGEQNPKKHPSIRKRVYFRVDAISH